jgi:hypothetical protein
LLGGFADSILQEGLSFTPDDATANVGDIVEFVFYPQNHSVARSNFKSPCIPYEDTAVGRQGFWSGFKPISVVLSQVGFSMAAMLDEF